jgi:hypothetical protein
LLVAACSADSGTDDADCSNYLVTPDAAVTGFAAVGEWRTDAVCTQYCADDFTGCQLTTATTVKCQKICG